jgi:hypothetical protein
MAPSLDQIGEEDFSDAKTIRPYLQKYSTAGDICGEESCLRLHRWYAIEGFIYGHQNLAKDEQLSKVKVHFDP